MRSSRGGVAAALARVLLLSYVISALPADGEAQTDASLAASSQSPVNRGAARQMFGSGNLRQADGSLLMPTVAGAAGTDEYPKEPNESRNNLRRSDSAGAKGRHDHGVPPNYEDRYRIPEPHYLPPGMSDLPRHVFDDSIEDDEEDDEDDSVELPSYRNGAPVNGARAGGFYGQAGRYGAKTRLGGDSLGYGRFDGGYDEYERRMPVNQMGRYRFKGNNGKGLVQELEDDGEGGGGVAMGSGTEAQIPCQALCTRDQFVCPRSCICIDLEHRCDGVLDCEGADDELNCDTITGEPFNHTCVGKRSVLCPTGKCIAKEWFCDGQNDCGDYSDESHCGPAKNCTKEQFECANGLCLPLNWVCDGDNDCKDFSDEIHCTMTKVCFDNHFACLDGTCIWGSMRCNGIKECPDGSDELKCEPVSAQCNENQFQCSYPRCIALMYRCDGDDDCGDGSDEFECPTDNNTSCNTNEFKCQNGDCISKKYVCDREIDCKDADDEHDCPTPQTCSSKEEFTCSNGLCIPRLFECDGVPDCLNGEDEQGCQQSCELTQYLCRTSPANATTPPPVYPAHWLARTREPHLNCINVKHVCDGFPDCPEKDDEENCPKKVQCTDKDKCSQRCILTVANKRACACDPGYLLGKDNATCEDINECEFQKEPVCSQLCKNTPGSFICECTKGYVLRPDLRSCKALGANPTLLLANRVDIRMISISDAKYTPVIKGLPNAIALDYHYKRGAIYWSDVSMDVIRKVFVNGTVMEDFIRWGLESPGGIAIDWIHDLLFWTDSGTRRVEVMTLDKRARHVLVSSDLDKPRAIAVHPNYGYVYWTDWGPNPKIERAGMDGSNRVALITENIYWPNGLTIDYTTDRMYWIDAKHRVIESAHIHGTDRKKVVTRGLHHPFAITVFEDSVYWTDWHFKSVSLANKNNGRDYKTIHSGLHFPMDLHSYHPQRQPDYLNHCGADNGKCSHMCLPNAMGYSCVCPVGQKINRNGKTCISSVENLLVFARKKDLRLISLDQSAKAFDVVIPVDNVESAVALTWDFDEEEKVTIYWTDVEADTISRASLDGSDQQAIVKDSLESPAGLAMDWVTKKLYWTDAGTNRVECSNLDGSMRAPLIYEGLDKPRDIVVDPTSGYMYWSDWGSHPKIEIAGMDGSDRRTLIGTDLTWPNGLAIDFEKKRLYWADGGTRKIEYSDLDGKHRTTVISPPNTNHPFGLVIYKNKIFWTDWDTTSIHRAEKDTGKNMTVIRSGIGGLMDVRVLHRDRPKVKNPCERNNGGCSHICLLSPKPKRYTCACHTGLVLHPDGKTCRDTPTKYLLISHRIDIRILSFDTNYTADIVLPMTDMKNVSGADVDLETDDIYWTDPGQTKSKIIQKASFEKNNKDSKQKIINRLKMETSTVIEHCIDTVDSLVVDSIGRKLYWTDVGLNSIEVSELNGTNRKVLIWSGLDNPRAIALHYPAGLLFWSDWGHNARIERADMDGEHRAAVVTEGLTWPNGLSIDLFADRIYWNDAKRKLIESADLTGNERRVIVEKVEHPYGLAVVGDFVYWSDWHERALLRAKKSDGKNRKVVLENLEGIMDLRYADKQQVRPENACSKNNGGCSHLCLRNPAGYKCTCPTGIVINADKRTCNATPSNFLLMTNHKGLAVVSLDTPGLWEVRLPVLGNLPPFSVDFHWEKQFIYYVNIGFNFLSRISMHNTSDTKILVGRINETAPDRVAVDWVADNLYWSDLENRSIMVSRLDGSSHKRLFDNLRGSVQSLALFPREGYLYWSEKGDNPTIERSMLDGSNRKSIVTTDLGIPSGLAIDYETRKLYWADGSKRRIEVSDLHGRYRVVLVPGALVPYGLALFGNNIYWSTVFRDYVESADKRTGKSHNKIRMTKNTFTTEIKAVSADRQKGWTPCAMENGGCSHLCFYTRKNYTCGCPDRPDGKPCSTVPSKRMPLRKPGTENDPAYDDINDEEEPLMTITKSTGTRNKPSDFSAGGAGGEGGEKVSLHTMIIIIVVLLAITVGIIVVIIYLQCPRKNKREEYLYNTRRNVLTFSNPNYNASTGPEAGQHEQQQQSASQDKKGFIWKRLKYDKSQERVYEDNGPASSPEVVSLIPPTATPSSSRAASVTPMESSPPVAIARPAAVSFRAQQQPSLVAAPKARPLV